MERVSALEYEVVDVFTDRPFAGNPLAVVFGAEALAKDQMQALALEFHLSETAFVLPPTVDGATYRLRIFTPSAELPFAGHPSVGAAVTQVRRGLIPAGPVLQECGVGVLPVHVHTDGRATLTGGPATLGPPLDPEPYLVAAGLSEMDLAGPAVRMAGCGIEFPYVAVQPNAVARAVATPVPGVSDVDVFSWDASRQVAHARVFATGLGVPEDPATGSAALGLGVWLVGSGLLPGEGESTYTVRQGIELHRPVHLECTVSAVDGQAVRVTVTGSVVPSLVARSHPTVCGLSVSTGQAAHHRTLRPALHEGRRRGAVEPLCSQLWGHVGPKLAIGPYSVDCRRPFDDEAPVVAARLDRDCSGPGQPWGGLLAGPRHDVERPLCPEAPDREGRPGAERDPRDGGLLHRLADERLHGPMLSGVPSLSVSVAEGDPA